MPDYSGPIVLPECPNCNGPVRSQPGKRPRKWCSEQCRWAAYHRGIKVPDPPHVERSQLSVYLPTTIHTALREQAEAEGMTISMFLTDVLTEALDA